MIKCFFVDLASINSDLPRSNFGESELDRLADLILLTGGLIRPLILKESGVEKYTVIEGHREYYAALIAKGKNIEQAEMVNAFVITSSAQQSAIEQLQLLKEDSLLPPAPVSVEQLLPVLLTAISQQIQPIVDQLVEHKKILDVLNLDRINLVHRQLTIDQLSNARAKNANISLVSIPDVAILPKQPKPKVEKVEKVKTPKTPKNTASKKIAALPASIDPIKANNTLNLINSLSQDDLIFKMQRSLISKAVIKLVPNIIDSRNIQPDQKFDRWETIATAKISGLGPAKITEIIEKLK